MELRPKFQFLVVLILASSVLVAQGLPAPTGLTVTSATSSSVQLTWTPPQAGAPAFLLERKPLGGVYSPAPNIPDGGVIGTTMIDSTIDPFTTYVYRVSSISLTDSSSPSSEVTVGPPPAGYNVVAPDPSLFGHNSDFGQQIQMVLDANGDPAISFLSMLRNEDDEYSNSALNFVSWNRAQYRWNPPVRVAVVDDIRVPNPQASVSLARDSQNNTLGLAYAVGSDLSRLDLALSTDGGATWKTQTIAGNADFQINQVALALYGGQGHLVFTKGVQGLAYITGSQTAVAARWTSTRVPLTPGLAGRPRAAFSLALDNTGAPGLAFWASQDRGLNSILGYWKPTSLNSVAVTDTNGILNEVIGCDLTFFGAQPRIAMFASRDKTSSAIWVSQSNDGGATWAPPVNVPQDGAASAGGYISLAAGSQGQGALVTEVNGGGSKGVQCGLPKLSRSPDFLTWTTCSPTGNQPPQTTPSFIRLTYAANDLLYMAFQNENFDTTNLKDGVVIWREPQPQP